MLAVALIGLVRVGTDKQKTQRQRSALDPICLKVFEEQANGKPAAEDRPALLDALSHIRDGDMLTVQEVDRLGRNLLEGLIVFNDLFQRGIRPGGGPPARPTRRAASGGRRRHAGHDPGPPPTW
ncbi:recombinase family protein [Spirillospora sp. NPDC048823]|uniref:recombinase family protein n=1 Tax=unclassified Spirillospora TaxID=2642701 RepID=UPI0037209C15